VERTGRREPPREPLSTAQRHTVTLTSAPQRGCCGPTENPPAAALPGVVKTQSQLNLCATWPVTPVPPRVPPSLLVEGSPLISSFWTATDTCRAGGLLGTHCPPPAPAPVVHPRCLCPQVLSTTGCSFCWWWFVCLFETGSHYVAQAGLKL
jgi:hypothetical protein